MRCKQTLLQIIVMIFSVRQTTVFSKEAFLVIQKNCAAAAFGQGGGTTRSYPRAKGVEELHEDQQSGHAPSLPKMKVWSQNGATERPRYWTDQKPSEILQLITADTARILLSFYLVKAR